MLEELNAATNFVASIIKISVILMTTPYLLAGLINVLCSLIGLFLSLERKPKRHKITVTRNQWDRTANKEPSYTINRYKQSKLTSDARRFLSITTFPGTLLRMASMILLLRIKGWEVSISYPGVVGKLNRGISDDRRSGFFISVRPNKDRKTTLKDTVHMSLVGYIPMILAYFMWVYRHSAIDFMIYLQQGNMNIIWIYVIYYYLLFAVLIGGAPIPEETMVPVYYLIGRYPHVIIGIIFSYCLSFLISLMEIDHLGFSANQVARTYFLLFSSIIIFRVLIDEKKRKLTRKDLDERILELEVVELL